MARRGRLGKHSIDGVAVTTQKPVATEFTEPKEDLSVIPLRALRGLCSYELLMMGPKYPSSPLGGYYGGQVG